MKTPTIFCIVVMVILIMAATVPVQAEDDALFLSTGSAHYQYSLNEEARIPVKITNNLGNDLPGTLVVQIRDPKTGEYVYSQSKQITAFSGEDMYYVSAGNAGDGQDILVDISFEYGNGPKYSSELKGIALSFSNEEPLDEEAEEGVETDTGSAPVKSTSEIKTENPETASYASGSADGEIDAVEKQTDANALKRTLLEEQIEREIRKNALSAAIKDDSLFIAVNKTLYDQNFTRLSLVVIPQGNNSGIFSSLYRDNGDEEVSLSGTITEEIIANIFENTTARIAFPVIFQENETFRSLINETESEGFVRSQTEINMSPRYSDLKILYDKGIYSAEIRAESVNGNVTAVSLVKDDILPFYILPLLILIFTCLNAMVIYVYYMYRPDTSGKGNTDEKRDDIQKYDSTDILDTAESLFLRGYKKEAVSMAVRVLRLKISSEHFAGKEISDRECREYLLENTYERNTEETIRILTSTEEQRFSKEDITESEFRSLTEEIRSLIQE
ncbi:hypothetical protein L0665_09415 [Methanogenium marinum]|uniref:DUF4129 domain-containing protein n=1 Tax=Methanogenium marinum TaxID=348610 RepID=A0A9Q4KU69_9EURY|nr:hypothetical protein [Methanogenium marinum]MDE4908824.1 hypothetical protein [Methanogenium marinum]